ALLSRQGAAEDAAQLIRIGLDVDLDHAAGAAAGSALAAADVDVAGQGDAAGRIRGRRCHAEAVERRDAEAAACTAHRIQARPGWSLDGGVDGDVSAKAEKPNLPPFAPAAWRRGASVLVVGGVGAHRSADPQPADRIADVGSGDDDETAAA